MPHLLLDYDVRHSLGWQHSRKTGPVFVVARLGRIGRVKVIDRFPLTEQGWSDAWEALADRDAGAAAAVAALLAQRDARAGAAAALAALDAESLCSMRLVKFTGGSGVSLAKGQGYDVRFLGDRIMICSPRSVQAILEIPNTDVVTVDVSGSSPRRSSGELVALIAAVGLVGALLGLLVLGVLGLVLGAIIFGLAAALVGAGSARIETIIRISGRDAELYFQYADKRPDALRIELSEPLRAIGGARGAAASDPDERAGSAAGSIPDQLSKLASLLQQGLITRDEFERLKVKLMADS